MKLAWITLALLALAWNVQHGAAQITGWTTPSISGNADGTGTVTLAEDDSTGATSTTFAATPTGSDSIAGYTLLTSGTPFSVTSAGVLTLDSALNFEATSSYTIEVRAYDDVTPTANSGTATITITVTDVNEFDPAFSKASYSVCILDDAVADTTLTTLTATDADTANTLSYTITGGNTGGPDFKIATASSGLIQVNTGVTLDKDTIEQYALEVTATDDGTAAKSGTTTVSVTVSTTCSSSVAATASILLLLVALLATLF